LKQHAIELALAARVLPNGTQTRTLTEDQIVLLYVDIDGDKALISSDAELEDAMNQFVSSGSVKIFAKPIDIAPVNGAPTESATRTASSPPNAGPRSTPKASARSTPNVQVQLGTLVDSLVTVLATSVIALSGQIQNVSSNAAIAARSSLAAPVATSPAAATPVATGHFSPETKPADEQPLLPGATTTRTEPQTPRLFIHGRHTCDNCLTTPIVGPRYHAVGMPDYDLCQTCMGNYHGSDEIKFEVVELGK
jgi:hypothetical protein